MAQDIEIANAQYSDVPSIEVPKQGGGVASYVDTTDADAVASEIDEGKTAYVNGIKLTGTRSGGGGGDVTTDTDQNITGVKTFVGQKKILFKQSGTNDKLGFTLYDASNNEKGYLEFNPTNKIDNAPLMTLGNYATSSSNVTQVGFRRYSNVGGQNGAYNILTPLIADAKSPFSLTTTYTNFYIPLGVTDGTTMVKTDKRGVLDISSLLPTPSGGGYSETVLFSSTSGVGSGTITLDGNISDYDLIGIKVWDGATRDAENNYIYPASFINDPVSPYGLLSLRSGGGGIIWKKSGDNTITIVETVSSNKIYRIIGIKWG